MDAVIARHIEALGGRAAIDALDAAIELLREQAQTRSAKLRATV